jgi:hypothetical protein
VKRWSLNQFAQIVYNHICATALKLLGSSVWALPIASPNFPSDPAWTPELGVLDDDRPRGLNSKQPCGYQARIRRGFSSQLLGMDHVAVDLHLEEGIQLRGL